jgi:hypothetical protein
VFPITVIKPNDILLTLQAANVNVKVVITDWLAKGESLDSIAMRESAVWKP